ncbi:hypothetical protein CALVIDRAFT_533988 [Calocera viscosa TUFC12733]|uniref:Uncharacterized protein n=1 Tax=Calocera viscosa (strain TUFC12733) TaxID=1330018 RepID=A0A167QA47_CALVF|nr:hypothetical protein CALVIDRAFT_533988 [Calocera viscosa TUFC12733]
MATPTSSLPGSSSNALSTGTGNSFQVQGQVDIPSIGTLTYDAASALLARTVDCGIEPHTLTAAYAIGARVALGPLAADNVFRAVRDLKVAAAFQQVLWFGFGIKHLIRRMVESKEGLGVIGLIGCMSECYPAPVCVSILERLFPAMDLPVQLAPSQDQWRRLVEALSGALSSSYFGFLLEKITDDCPGLPTAITFPPPSTSAKSKRPTYRQLQPVPVKELVEALHQALHLSTSTGGSIHLIGGPDCGWVAAVAHWLMDLTVKIHKPNSVMVLGGRSRHEIMLEVTYADGLQLKQVKVAERCYVIPGGQDLLRQFSHVSQTPLQPAGDYGRVSWEKALSRTFGPAAEELLFGPGSAECGRAMGYAAHLFGLYGLQPDLPACLRSISGCRLSCGVDFPDTALHYLPELEQATALMQSMRQTIVEASNTLSFMDAEKLFNQAMSAVCRQCDCVQCSPAAYNRHASVEATMPIRSCKLGLVLFLCVLVLILSRVSVEVSLGPRRSALEHWYLNCISKLPERRENHVAKTLSGIQFQTCLREVVKIDYLREVLRIFTLPISSPGDVTQETAQACALSSRGICVYMRALCAITDEPLEISRIHVIPGCIEFNGTVYERVVDAKQQPAGRFEGTLEGHWAPYNDHDGTFIDSSSKRISSNMAVYESGNDSATLCARYDVQLPNLRSKVVICPADISETVLCATFPVHCPGYLFPPSGAGEIHVISAERVWFTKRRGISALQIHMMASSPNDGLLVGLRILPTQVLSRWVALHDSGRPADDLPLTGLRDFAISVVLGSGKDQRGEVPFLQTGQCLSCCVNTLREMCTASDKRGEKSVHGIPVIIVRDTEALRGRSNRLLTNE